MKLLKKNPIKRHLKLFVAFFILLFSCLGLAFRPLDDYFEISKNIDVFVTLFREVNTFYVDEVKPGEMMKKGIDAMLESLDPYTNFISESEIEDYRFMTTGEYGGVGAIIREMDGRLVVTEVYEGFAAQKSGIRAGDMFVEVDGKNVMKKTSDEISKMLKGQSGTKVKIVIERPGEKSFINLDVTREEIKVKSVPYYGMLNKNTGYIKLTGFTESASQEVKDALIKLKAQNGCTSLVLDLRDNPGGLLNEAVEIVNLFTEKGTEIVFTKGKIKEWDKSYKTTNSPADLNIPLVVLVNKNSASASEIVSGALQDLDRAVIVGQRTYGKGLVQQTRPLNYGNQVKITVAKYYVPSGRCIQAINYSNRKSDGVVEKVPDSLITAFKTKGGRVVYDGAGINPDVITEPVLNNALINTLIEENYIFNYATDYTKRHGSIPAAGIFKLNEEDYGDFVKYVESKKINYHPKSENLLLDLKQKLESDGYYNDLKTQYEALINQVEKRKKEDILKNKVEIIPWVEEEIAGRYYYQRGRTECAIKYDKEISSALDLIASPEKTKTILTKIDKPTKPFNPLKKF